MTVAAASLETNVVNAVRSVVPGKAALHEPVFGAAEARYVAECVETGWVSSVGKFVDRFERDLEKLTGSPHAVAVVNGTAALHLSLVLAGVEPGDEVVVPSLTFAATANAVWHRNAVPHFADAEDRTLGIDAAKLDCHLLSACEKRSGKLFNKSTGRRVSALVAVHIFGHPCDVEGLASVAAKHGLVLIEDAAESLGSTWRGRHTGTFARLGVLSFNGNKIVTTGGGGAVLASDPETARRAKHVSTTAKVPHRWEYAHDEIGYNYRLPNLNAALGCAQLERLPDFVAKKRALAARYASAFSGVAGVRFLAEPDGARSNYWLNAILLDEPSKERRDAVLEKLNGEGLLARPAWKPLHKLPMNALCPRSDCSTAETLEARIVNLPSGAAL